MTTDKYSGGDTTLQRKESVLYRMDRPMAHTVIPLVDMSQDQGEAAQQVRKACTESGFFDGAQNNEATCVSAVRMALDQSHHCTPTRAK